jgi:multiple sugar transport system permease protein
MRSTVAPPRPVVVAPPDRLSRHHRSDLRAALLFMAPATVGFVAFYLVPVVRGTYLSFTDFSLFGSAEWIGLRNYRDILHDDLFWNAMKVTTEYVVLNIGFQTVIAIGLAVLLDRVAKSVIIRGALLLPYFVANVVVALLWFWLLDYQIGIVNAFLDWIGVGRVSFFGNETWAIPTIAFVNTWRHMGYTALLIFAGLQVIPRHLYEAAAIDGASALKAFWRITMPLLRPVLMLVLIITVIGSFQVFDTVAVTTKGGPENASRVIQMYIYQRAFAQSDFGYASALSVILLLVLAVVAYLQAKALRGNRTDLA